MSVLSVQCLRYESHLQHFEMSSTVLSSSLIILLMGQLAKTQPPVLGNIKRVYERKSELVSVGLQDQSRLTAGFRKYCYVQQHTELDFYILSFFAGYCRFSFILTVIYVTIIMSQCLSRHLVVSRVFCVVYCPLILILFYNHPEQQQ